MTNIKAVVQNQGENPNGEVAYNVVQIQVANEFESCIPQIYEIYDSIKSYVGFTGVPFRRSWYGEGVGYWFESGIVFESEQSKLLSIKAFEKELLEMLRDSFPEHEMVKDGTLSIKVSLFNAQYEN
ncbi:MAG: hypothetical protein JXR88_14605 [Clostridia bacterium]|nr:hypothetical protein [Clostridia bacterium]